jgi:hydroxymethylpyrimidine pyrophosphatase-like HAD family hydrolase
MPAVTLNTGRPSPYVEAIMQAIAGWRPALYENGAGLYLPETYSFEFNPLISQVQQQMLKAVVNEVDQALVGSGKAYWQPGKTICYTLFARPPWTMSDFQDVVRGIAARYGDQISVASAGLSLNIYPSAINKGTGLSWLAHRVGIDPVEMLGVGDSSGDIEFLRLVGRPAAPANAEIEVKAVAAYVSPYADAKGLHDILDHFGFPARTMG